MAVGSPGTWQPEKKPSGIFISSSLWEQVTAKTSFGVGLIPTGSPAAAWPEAGEGKSRCEGAGRCLGASRAGSERSSLRSPQLRGLAPASALFAQVQLE